MGNSIFSAYIKDRLLILHLILLTNEHLIKTQFVRLYVSYAVTLVFYS